MIKVEILKKQILTYLNKSFDNLKYVGNLKKRNNFSKYINSNYSVYLVSSFFNLEGIKKINGT